MTDRTPGSSAEAEELERLRSEVSQLRGELETERRRGFRTLAARKVIAAVLAVVAAFGAVASVIGIWGARTTLNTDRWVSTVAPLPQDPQVADAVSTYVTREVLRALDVRDRIAAALPPNAAFLATPVSGAMNDYVKGAVNDVLRTPQFANLWVGVNRAAHAQIVAVLDNRSEVVKTGDGTVTLNLLPVVNNVLSALEQRAPTLFGKQVALPELTTGQVPANLQTRIETALGVQLPNDFANVTIYSGDQVGALQDAVRTFKRYLALLIVGTLAALGLALWVSPSRRRTTLQLGIWLIIATVALTTLLRAVREQILDNVPQGVYRNGAASTLTIVFSSLRERGVQLLVLGIVVALIAYLAGAGRGATWVRGHVIAGRRAAARGGRWVVAEDHGRAWIRANLDPLRIGGVVVAAIVALLLSSWASLLVMLILLAAYEAAVTLLAQAGPPAPTAEPGEPEPRTVVLPGPRRDEEEEETDVEQTTEPAQKMPAT